MAKNKNHHPEKAKSPSHEPGEISPFDVENPDVSPPSQDSLDELRRLGEGDEYEELLDTLAADYLATNVPEFSSNAAEMRTRPPLDRQKEIKAAQRELLSRARRYVVERAGLGTDARSPLEKAQAHVADVLEHMPEEDRDDREKLYEAVGVKHIDPEAGYFWYSSVKPLLPEDRSGQYAAYKQAREDLQSAGERMSKGLATKEDVMEADRAQRAAHNGLANTLTEVFADVGMTFDEARDLATRQYLGAMRLRDDNNHVPRPHHRAALEMGRTVTDAMREHLLPGHSSLPDPELYHGRLR